VGNPVKIRLHPELIAEIEQKAAELKISRSEYLRRLVADSMLEVKAANNTGDGALRGDS
jgi:hypothetical protein